MLQHYAARFQQPVEHSEAVRYEILGGVVGALVGVIIVMTTGKYNWACTAITVSMTIGRRVGEMPSVPGEETGKIVTGSRDTYIGKMAVARAVVDVVMCDGTPGIPLPTHDDKRIAQGSATVSVNRRLAARVGEKIECGATIAADHESSRYVIIGGPTQTLLGIEEERPKWLDYLRKGIMIVGHGPILGLASIWLEEKGGEWADETAEVYGANEDQRKLAEMFGEIGGELLGEYLAKPFAEWFGEGIAEAMDGADGAAVGGWLADGIDGAIEGVEEYEEGLELAEEGSEVLEEGSDAVEEGTEVLEPAETQPIPDPNATQPIPNPNETQPVPNPNQTQPIPGVGS